MYINTQTQQYPVSESQIRSEFPNTSFAVPFAAPESYAWVFPAPAPSYDAIAQGVREIAPVRVNGKYQQAWETFDLPAEAIAANQAAQAQRIQDEIVANTQKRLDDFAKTRNYDGILSACTYATDPNAIFAAEGQYCVAQRSATWAKLYQIMTEVQLGLRPAPKGYAEVEPLLPALVWPAAS